MSDIPRGAAVPEEEVDLGPGEEAEAEDVENPEADADAAGGDADDDGGQEEGAEAEDDVEAAPRRGGGSRTIREQRRRAQEAERRTAALEREVQELRTVRQQPAYDPQAAARQEQEFYASLQYMPEEQRLQAVVQRERQTMGQALQNLQFQQQELADQTRFDAACARSPTREAYRDRVEDYVQRQRRAGFVISREDAYYLVMGKDVDARAAKARPAQQRAAAARTNGQQTRPTGARSNTQPGVRRPQAGSLDADRELIRAAISRGESVF